MTEKVIPNGDVSDLEGVSLSHLPARCTVALPEDYPSANARVTVYSRALSACSRQDEKAMHIAALQALAQILYAKLITVLLFRTPSKTPRTPAPAFHPVILPRPSLPGHSLRGGHRHL